MVRQPTSSSFHLALSSASIPLMESHMVCLEQGHSGLVAAASCPHYARAEMTLGRTMMRERWLLAGLLGSCALNLAVPYMAAAQINIGVNIGAPHQPPPPLRRRLL